MTASVGALISSEYDRLEICRAGHASGKRTYGESFAGYSDHKHGASIRTGEDDTSRPPASGGYVSMEESCPDDTVPGHVRICRLRPLALEADQFWLPPLAPSQSINSGRRASAG